MRTRSLRSAARRAGLALLGAAACTGAPPDPEPGSALRGWPLHATASETAVRDVLEASDGDGWIALHQHEHAAAWTAFHPEHPLLARRAAWDEQRRLTQLDRLHDLVTRELLRAWSALNTLPEGGGVEALIGMQAWCHGSSEARAEALARLPEGATYAGLRAALSGEPTSPDATDPFSERLRLHERARAGEPDPLLRATATPLLTVQDGELTRRWYDPCAHRSLAAAWGLRAEPAGSDPLVQALAVDGLHTSLLAPWLDANDLRAASAIDPDPATLLSALPSLTDAGLGPLDRAAATPEQARLAARELTRTLDGWHAQLLVAPGGAIEAELDLLARHRALWVVHRADDWLRHTRADLALAVLEPAVDATAVEVSALNPPELFLLLAEARVHTGRARQALDALRPVADVDPSVGGLHELLADLVVVQGIHRQGDSKEY